MDKELYEVIPLEANLRSLPVLEPKTILTRLKQGQLVSTLSATPAPPKGWLRVRAEVQGTPVEGFIKAFLLRKAKHVQVPLPPPVLPNLPEAHLTPEGPIRRTGTGMRAYALKEQGQPGRQGPSPTDQALQLGKIISYLDVERSARYLPKSGQTFCNIYAHDYCHLAGVYLPRVWWRPKALLRITAGEAVPVAYGTTVAELNANSLYNWLEEFGTDFGWRRTLDLTELQNAANMGQVALICGQRTELNQPGHICPVVPETEKHRVTRRGGIVTTPLQSQAGASNFRYGGRTWWADSKRFARFGFWIHS